MALVPVPASGDQSGSENNPFDEIRERAPVEPPVPAPPPFNVPSNVETAPIMLAKAHSRLRTGDVVGRFEGALFGTCALSSREIPWPGGRYFPSEQDMADIFADEMLAIGYNAVQPDYGFAAADPEVDYYVAAILTNLDLRLCQIVDFWSGLRTGELKGTVRLSVEWEVLDALTRRVVYRTRTDGGAKLDDGSIEAISILIQRGFARATAYLASNEEFLALTRRDGKGLGVSPAPRLDAPLIAVTGRSLFAASAADRFDEAQEATVAIVRAESHGSGFFISGDGYILTNQHVVGNQDQVRVRLHNGFEVIGEVLRRHRDRDVALVKVQVANATALPIDTRLPAVGSDVYAIGAPLDEKLQGTVSRGIVSAHRPASQREPSFIQGDVDIHGGNSGGPLTDAMGNVVGISVEGVSGSVLRTSVGLNFFVPVAEALQALNVQLAAGS